MSFVLAQSYFQYILEHGLKTKVKSSCMNRMTVFKYDVKSSVLVAIKCFANKLLELVSSTEVDYGFGHEYIEVQAITNFIQSINQFYFLLSATSSMPLALYNGTHTLV